MAAGGGEDPLGIGVEAFRAARVAEEVGRPAVRARDHVGFFEHFHPAHRVESDELPPVPSRPHRMTWLPLVHDLSP